MRLNALEILAADTQVEVARLGKSTAHFATLLTDDDLAAAIVTTAARNPDLQRVLSDGRFELCGLDEQLAERLALTSPSLRPFTIRAGSLIPGTPESPPVPGMVTASPFL